MPPFQGNFRFSEFCKKIKISLARYARFLCWIAELACVLCNKMKDKYTTMKNAASLTRKSLFIAFQRVMNEGSFATSIFNVRWLILWEKNHQTFQSLISGNEVLSSFTKLPLLSLNLRIITRETTKPFDSNFANCVGAINLRLDRSALRSYMSWLVI